MTFSSTARCWYGQYCILSSIGFLYSANTQQCPVFNQLKSSKSPQYIFHSAVQVEFITSTGAAFLAKILQNLLAWGRVT